jgi:hypothetical protein
MSGAGPPAPSPHLRNLRTTLPRRCVRERGLTCHGCFAEAHNSHPLRRRSIRGPQRARLGRRRSRGAAGCQLWRKPPDAHLPAPARRASARRRPCVFGPEPGSAVPNSKFGSFAARPGANFEFDRDSRRFKVCVWRMFRKFPRRDLPRGCGEFPKRHTPGRDRAVVARQRRGRSGAGARAARGRSVLPQTRHRKGAGAALTGGGKSARTWRGASARRRVLLHPLRLLGAQDRRIAATRSVRAQPPARSRTARGRARGRIWDDRAGQDGGVAATQAAVCGALAETGASRRLI